VIKAGLFWHGSDVEAGSAAQLAELIPDFALLGICVLRTGAQGGIFSM
jgi:hypothetical protein